MSVRPSVSLSLEISVTTEPIGFYSSGNISFGPVVVIYFLGGLDTPLPKKSPSFCLGSEFKCSDRSTRVIFLITSI